jgi:hypothetical protein
MRAWPAIAIVLLATPAFASTSRFATLPHDPMLPHWDAPKYQPNDTNQLPDYARLKARDDADAAPGGLSLGPIHAESETINGHRRMHYRVDGLSVLGGDVGGSLGHGGAMLTLHWASPAN